MDALSKTQTENILSVLAHPTCRGKAGMASNYPQKQQLRKQQPANKQKQKQKHNNKKHHQHQQQKQIKQKQTKSPAVIDFFLPLTTFITAFANEKWRTSCGQVNG